MGFAAGGGVAAGGEEIVAEASPIEPNVTGEPCFTAVPTLALGTLTPSLRGTDWPRPLGRREWVRCGCWEEVGAGDWERGDVEAVF